MKNLQSTVLQLTLIIATIIGTVSCTTNKQEDTKEVAEDRNEAKFENKSENDAQFLVNAAEINMEEIALGQLAQEKGNMKHVKDLGKMMVTEHTKAMADLTALAQKKNITLPTSQTENGKEAYNDLMKKSGNDFGMAYSDKMVKGHKDAISIFEKASTKSADPEIKAWATSMLPALRTHLDHSMISQKECEKMKK